MVFLGGGKMMGYLNLIGDEAGSGSDESDGLHKPEIP